MKNFKSLNWQTRGFDGTIYAEPHGLKKYYYIYPPLFDDLLELVLRDSDGNFNEEVTMHQTVQSAQAHAENHYVNILKCHTL